MWDDPSTVPPPDENEGLNIELLRAPCTKSVRDKTAAEGLTQARSHHHRRNPTSSKPAKSLSHANASVTPTNPRFQHQGTVHLTVVKTPLAPSRGIKQSSPIDTGSDRSHKSKQASHQARTSPDPGVCMP